MLHCGCFVPEIKFCPSSHKRTGAALVMLKGLMMLGTQENGVGLRYKHCTTSMKYENSYINLERLFAE